MKHLLMLGLILSLISCQQQPMQAATSADPASATNTSSVSLAATRISPSQAESPLPSSITTGQTRIPNYAYSRDNVFWPKLYPNEGYSLYCNYRFDNEGTYINYLGSTATMSVEHVFSAQWIATYFGCANRTACQIEAFHYAEADLHNLWAADRGVNSSRSDHPFAELPDHESEERWRNEKIFTLQGTRNHWIDGAP